MMRYLASSIILSLILAVGGYGLYSQTHTRLLDARKGFDALRKEALALRQRYQHTANDEPAIREGISRYSELVDRGVVGTERRLDWADTTRRAMHELHIQEGNFSLAPQRDLPGADAAGRFRIHASTMSWHAPLLHEGDLLYLLDTFAHIDSAIVAPRQCTLTERAINGVDRATLDADCEFDWLTLAPVDNSAPKAAP